MMILPLDIKIVCAHKQLYGNSCVPMSLEFVLKLIGQVGTDYYELQDEKGDVQRGGVEYDGKLIKGLTFKYITEDWGLNFPLEEIFESIKYELAHDRYVIVTIGDGPYHNVIVYGYDETRDEFLGVTRYHNDADYKLINDVKNCISINQGTGILIYSENGTSN